MKNMIYAVMALSLGSGLIHQLDAKSPAENIVEFRTMEGRNKTDWITFMDNQQMKKGEMMKKQINDWVELGNTFVKNLGSLKNIEGRDELLHAKLQNAIKLEKEHTQQWKVHVDDAMKEMKMISEKHDKELADFEKSMAKK